MTRASTRPAAQAGESLPPAPRPELEGLPVYEPGRAAARGAVKLASNENPYGPSPRVLRALRSIKDIERYPDGSCLRLRSALSKSLRVPEDHLLIGAGSDEIGDLIGRAYLRPRDAVVYPKYSFIRYAMIARMSGALPVETRVRADFSIDVADLVRVIRFTRPRVVFLANPNNPTGAYLARPALRDILRAIPPSTLFALDEAYFEYASLSADYPDGIAHLPACRNLVVLRTFSKIHALAGLRVGFAAAHPSIIAELHKVRPPFNVNSVAQIAAIAAIRDRSHVRSAARSNAREREKLRSALGELGYRVFQSAGNFLMMDAGMAGRDFFSILARRGLILRTLHPYGLPNFIRITTGTPGENRRLLRAIRAIPR